MMRKIVKFYGISFSNIGFNELFEKIQNGGILVAPAASALINIEEDKSYYNSLIRADFVILDSGLLCILLRIFKGHKVKKLSGYLFLKKLISKLKNKDYKVMCIDPSIEESKINRKFLIKSRITNISSYIAPIYKCGEVTDNDLINIIKKNKPKYILINIGGGIQEKLGIFIRDTLNYKPIIICTGAAIAFLTGKQAPINNFIDKIYLGWLCRIIYNPKIFLTRTLRSIKLINFFLKL
tara:strand:+ start:112 stop:825 length:714 start_codon:yes stop_codon:yes gene_type:complete